MVERNGLKYEGGQLFSTLFEFENLTLVKIEAISLELSFLILLWYFFIDFKLSSIKVLSQKYFQNLKTFKNSLLKFKSLVQADNPQNCLEIDSLT